MIKNYGKNSRFFSIIILAVIGCMLLAIPVLAAGDGSGGGQSIPLGLDASTPADGQKDFPLTGDIKLTFNKNVIYLLIKDENKTCFSLIASDGGKVPIEVIMADDQTPEGFELRRDISIRPLQKLLPGTAYAVKISPQLQAKNGTSLGHEVTVNFITAGVAPKPVETTPVIDAEQGQANNNQSPTTPDSVTGQEQGNTQSAPITGERNVAVITDSNSPAAEKVQTAEDKVQPSEEKSPATAPVQNQQRPNTTYAVAAGLVVLAALGYVYSRKRNKR